MVIDSTMSGDAGGYAIYDEAPTTTVTVSDSTINQWGFGIYNRAGTLNVSDSTICNNLGGGIFSSDTTLTVVSSTIADNGERGLVVGSGIVTLYDTIVAGNDSGHDDIEGAVASTSSANLIGVNTGLSGISNGSGNEIGTAANPIRPFLLTALGKYGGTTLTMALLPGSPALGAGDSNAGPTDQRGLGPPPGAAFDIGEFESQGFTITANSGSGQSTPINTPFLAPLDVTVTANNPSEPTIGGLVEFAGPTGGVASLAANSTAYITDGLASFMPTANGTIGSYIVTASSTGVAGTVSFALTNLTGGADGLSPDSECAIQYGHSRNPVRLRGR